MNRRLALIAIVSLAAIAAGAAYIAARTELGIPEDAARAAAGEGASDSFRRVGRGHARDLPGRLTV
ncbi:MAG: hypothetical protein ACRD0U_20685 [Acidimicrobiales bacterium]